MKRSEVIADLREMLSERDWDWWWGDKEVIEEAIRYLEESERLGVDS